MKGKQNKDRHQHQSEGSSSCVLCCITSSYFSVEDVDREPPAWDPKDGSIVEEPGEAFGVQSGTGHQHLQVCSEPGDVFN